MTLASLALALVAALHPGTPAPREFAFARVAADVVATAEPMPGRSREDTLAIVVVTAWEEGGFRNVVGDHGRARCTMQVHARSRAEARHLDTSLEYCVRRGLEILRASARSCPGAPLAPYCGSCGKGKPRRMSARRLARAAAIVRAAKASLLAAVAPSPHSRPRS